MCCRSTFLGSRALAGTLLKHKQLSARGADGVTLEELLRSTGVQQPAEAVAALALDPKKVRLAVLHSTRAASGHLVAVTKALLYLDAASRCCSTRTYTGESVTSCQAGLECMQVYLKAEQRCDLLL